MTVKPLVFCLAGMLAAGLLGGDRIVSASAPQVTRSVHVSVLTEDGVPITDLTPADFEVEEDGKTREIASAALSSRPIRLTFLVADEGTGSFQQALVTAIQPLLAIAEVSLVSVAAQPERVLDFTSDAEQIVAGIQKLGQRPAVPGGGQLMEAIAEAANAPPAAGKRSVVVAMRLGGSASSSLQQDDVRDAMRKNGVLFYAFSPVGNTGAGGGAPMSYGGAGGMARTDYAAAEATYRSRNLESVINDGSKQTGGRHLQFSGGTIISMMEQLAQELQSQYELTYTLPAGVKPHDELEISTKRSGARVYAPTRIAN